MRENIDKNSSIGFFDSGVGGLSVYSRFRSLLPNENTIYFGDLKNMPYGNKTKDELIGFAKNILNYFESKNVKAVVIACNTSSAIAYEEIKSDYDFKIYPIIQSCTKVISGMNIDTVGVFATAATINSGVYKRELKKYNNSINVIEISCPEWTSIVESGGVNTQEKYDNIKGKMEEILKYNPDKIVLGCTHYPYLLSTLEKFYPKECFIDPAEIFVKYIKSDLKSCSLLNTTSSTGMETFYVSANPDNFVENSKLFYDIKTPPLIANLGNVSLSLNY